MTFTDTHCHLADPKLANTLPAVLAEAQAAGVARFIVPATSPKDWHSVAQLERLSENIHIALGIHPWFSDGLKRWRPSENAGFGKIKRNRPLNGGVCRNSSPAANFQTASSFIIRLLLIFSGALSCPNPLSSLLTALLIFTALITLWRSCPRLTVRRRVRFTAC